MPQGGLEVPYKLIFEGNGGDISKVSILLANCKEDDKKTKGRVSTTAEEGQAIDADRGNDLESDQPVAKRRKEQDIVEEWVRIGKISLKNSDRKVLLEGDKLSDLHINACQVLLAKQFPSLMGLKSTLVKHHNGEWTNNIVQILHVQARNHWIIASTIGCNEREVRVYDSLFCDIHETTRSTIQGMFYHSIAITMPNVQQQDGIKDCGPFAVAFVTILASEGNSETLLTSIRFDQDKLRAHLCACLENQNITSFPVVHTGDI